MKFPHGLGYAILIIVAILALTLYARQQGSSIVAGTAVKTQPREPIAEEAASSGKSDDGSKAEDSKNAEDAPK
ncbi:MAG: hypothetical protein Q7J42_10405 [Sulfuritalea sp.]|nr:hypothetical protein [Sulfuritalea sp.]